MVSRETSDQKLLAGVQSLLHTLGIELPPGDQEALAAHLGWLLATNQQLNLTSVAAADTALDLHLGDSLLALQEINAAPAGLLCDIGTGGGFPGLPLAIATGRRAVLLDSVAKKARALAEFVEILERGDQVDVRGVRSEHFALQRQASCAVVVARAVAQLPILVELASPLLTHGGRFVAFKASPTADELDRGMRAAARAGLAEVSRRSSQVPHTDHARLIITFEKVHEPEIALPRRPGAAKKRPLA